MSSSQPKKMLMNAGARGQVSVWCVTLASRPREVPVIRYPGWSCKERAFMGVSDIVRRIRGGEEDKISNGDRESCVV